MTKQEFESRIGDRVDSKFYTDVIEKVYNFHPLIPDVGGKDKIAEFFILGGTRLMYDMLPTALKAEQLEAQINAARQALNALTDEYDTLKRGY